MWCKSCNIETNDTVCPICGSITVEDIPTEVYWCKHCSTPIIQEETQADKGVCPICGRPTKYLTDQGQNQFLSQKRKSQLWDSWERMWL